MLRNHGRLRPNQHVLGLLGLAIGTVLLALPVNALADTYQQQDLYTTTSDTDYVAAADFTGDGFKDIAISETSNNQVVLYENDGTGNFSSSDTIAVATPYALETADLDADGTTDLIVGNTNGDFYYYLNTNNGSFGAATGSVTTAIQQITDFDTADIDGDGDLDVVWVDFGAGNSNVHTTLNDGTGNFSAQITKALGFKSTSITAGDYTAASPATCPTEFAINNVSATSITVLKNTAACNGTVAFGSVTATTSITLQLVGTDLSNDGLEDIVASEPMTDSIETFKNNNPASPSPSSAIISDDDAVPGNAGPYYLAPGDIDGDGNQDIATSNTYLNNVALLHGNGSDLLHDRELVSLTNSGDTPSRLVLADLDGDSKDDLVVLVDPTNGFEVLLSSPEPVVDPCVSDPSSCETTETTAETTTTATEETTATGDSTELTEPTTVSTQISSESESTTTTATTTTVPTESVKPLAVSLSLSKTLRVRSIRIKVTSNRTASFKIAPSIKLGGRTIKLRSKRKVITAGTSFTFKFKVTGSKKTRVISYLRGGRKPKISLKVSALTTDSSTSESYSKTKTGRIKKK